jgi:hypothetical protein
MKKTGMLFAVLIMACAVAAVPQRKETVIRLAKPNLIYVNEQVVMPSQLDSKLLGDSITIRLDPEIQLSTLQALQAALKAASPSTLEVKGSGRWILDTIVESRSRGDANE